MVKKTTKLYELLLDISVPSTVEWMRPVIYFTLVNKAALLLQSHVNMINSYAITHTMQLIQYYN